LKFEHLDFVFVSDFDIRISDLLVLSKRHSCQVIYSHVPMNHEPYTLTGCPL